MAYPPTSLDFINRPNPVEPHAVPEKHPLNDTPRLEQTSKDDFLRMLLDDSSANTTTERPAKRRKSRDATSTLLDLPKLPAVKNGVKRMRIPPILRGLHQPPPDAGLLPSISVEQPVRLTNASGVLDGDAVAKPSTTSISQDRNEETETIATPPCKAPTICTKAKRNKWSDSETADLLKGVARFGIGNWTRILKCPDYKFNGRNAIDVKDRFRVCCPTEYRNDKEPPKAKPSKPSSGSSTSQVDTPQSCQPAKSERKAKIEMRSIGIEEPFERSKRRPRKGYSDAEDAALLTGFNQYGNSWVSIQNDPALGLCGRTAMDIRDRFRTKYPDQYRKAGLTPRPETFPKETERTNNDNQATETDVATSKVVATVKQIPPSTNTPRKQKENKDPSSHQTAKPKPATSILQFDDVFWGAPLDDEDLDRPTLDRQILDWPFEARATPANPIPGHDFGEALAYRSTNTGISSSSHLWSGLTVPGGTLPSLAAITSGADDFTMQLELPTLASILGSLDEGGRGGGQIPTLEELLS